MPLIRSGGRLMFSDVRRGLCGDCPGVTRAQDADLPPGPEPGPVFPPPVAPTPYDAQDYLLLEGFEHPAEYLDGTATGLYNNVANVTLSSVVRPGGKTAGQSLEAAGIAGANSIAIFGKSGGAVAQYFRAYVQIAAYASPSNNLIRLLGWTDTGGYRYFVQLPPGPPSQPGAFAIENSFGFIYVNTPGTFRPQLGVWYRLEFLTEQVSQWLGVSGNYSVMNLWTYDGDTMTLLDHAQRVFGGGAAGGYPFVGPGSTNPADTVRFRYDDVRVEMIGSRSRPPVATETPKRGPGGVWALMPAGIGQSEWTPVGGPANFQVVTGFPSTLFDEDTSYVEASGRPALFDTYPVTPFPSPVPTGVITAVLVRARCREVTGVPGAAGNPTVAALYQDALGTIWDGTPTYVDSPTYVSYPINQSFQSPHEITHATLLYDPVPLHTHYIPQQAMGLRRVVYVTAGSDNPAPLRCTTVWGNMDVVVGEASQVPCALMTGFEGGIGEAGVGLSGANVFSSFTWSPINPYLDAAPPLKTDVVHSGAYSLQIGGATGSRSGIEKDFTALVMPPFTISQTLYVSVLVANPGLFMYLGFLGTPASGKSPVLGVLLQRPSGGPIMVTLQMMNHASGASVTGTVPLALATMYRLFISMTVAANGTDWAQECTVYEGDTMTVNQTLTQSGTGYLGANGVSGFKLGDINDLDPGSEARVDDLKVSLAGLLPRTPYGLALINPSTDVLAQWTRAGAAVAVSNAANVGRLPSQWTPRTDHVNQTGTPGSVDRFGLDVSRVPNKRLLQGYLQARSVADAAHTYNLRAWDPAGPVLDGPTVSAADGSALSQRTDNLMALDLRGVSLATLAQYHIGYVATGSGTTPSLRQILELWGTIEYDPTS